MPPSSDFALGGSRPNVILFLTDDWPWELWPTVTHGSGGLPNNYSALLPSLSEEFVLHVHGHGPDASRAGPDVP